MIIEDLENYIKFSNSLVKKGVLTKDNLKTLDLEEKHMFTHFKNLDSRLKRLKILLSIAKEKLSTKQMEQIWDVMVTKSELREHD